MILSTNDREYRQCAISVMDNIADPDIVFDRNGVSNYVYEYNNAFDQLPKGQERERKLNEIISTIKNRGKNKKYDCLIGISGGVDSTYVAWLVKQYGLRPLAVHLDNGWDSELAVKNIENIISRLGFDLYTLVVNWDEFRDIQRAYLKASVVDIEIVSDHAIFASMYRLAKKHNIDFIVSGTNVTTEFIMPVSWIYKKMDYDNLRDIYSQFGTMKLKTYPTFNFRKYIYYSAILKLSPISILNYIPYEKSKAKEIISKELDWKDYGGKHYESIFTKFYQAYILPAKFKIDKRKPHLSNLICSGQISKEQAIKELELPLYDEHELEMDKEYILKKLGFSENEFEHIMNLPVRRHEEFKSDTQKRKRYMTLLERTEKYRKLFK